MPGDLRERLQAPADVVSVWRGPFRRPALRLGQTRVGADVPAAGVRLLAGRTLGTGECHYLLPAGRGNLSATIKT